MLNELFKCFVHEISICKIPIFLDENDQFFSKCSECINVHQNASKCMQNELCKGFVHESIKELVLITFKGAKIDKIHFPLYGGSPCRLHFKLEITKK